MYWENVKAVIALDVRGNKKNSNLTQLPAFCPLEGSQPPIITTLKALVLRFMHTKFGQIGPELLEDLQAYNTHPVVGH